MNINKFFLYPLVMILLASCTLTSGDMQVIQPEQRSISVTGDAEVKASPDIAQIIFGIRTTDKDILTAKENNQKITSSALSALKALNVKETDIESEFLNVYPDPKPETSLYVAQTSIKVTIHDFSHIETILTNVLKTGVTNVQGIYYQVSDIEMYKEQANLLALQEAELKAATMADKLGQEIGLPISIREAQYPIYTYGYNPILATYNYDYGNINYAINDSTVLFEQITVRANVNVEFALK